jgi:glyoxylase-like metal-dependent hydrolase (beta-lactamase superfamily II)
MDSVKVLVRGYAQKEKSGRWNATSTATLVKSQGKNVLIDPGLFPDDIKAALAKENLKLEDIDIVVNSHSHQDHARNARLFNKEKVFNVFFKYKKIPNDLFIPGTQIRVIFTPGHVDKHVVFLVDTAEGKCLIAGDIFWWADDEEQKTDAKSLIERIDPFAEDQALLQESRKKLLSLADYVIPGHGEVFKVPNG